MKRLPTNKENMKEYIKRIWKRDKQYLFHIAYFPVQLYETGFVMIIALTFLAKMV